MKKVLMHLYLTFLMADCHQVFHNCCLSVVRCCVALMKMVKINENEPFDCIGNSITSDCLVLLADGSILYPYGDVFKRYQIEEQPVYISGRYILTELGNVFYLQAEKEYSAGESLRCVYDGGDMV